MLYPNLHIYLKTFSMCTFQTTKSSTPTNFTGQWQECVGLLYDLTYLMIGIFPYLLSW